MTHDEIISLTGRDLDAAVAALISDTLNAEGWWVSGDGSRCRYLIPPPYSTDMRAAWRVAERFRLTATPKQDATEKSSWLADWKLKGQGECWCGFGPTAAIAICRAALHLREDKRLNMAEWKEVRRGAPVDLSKGEFLTLPVYTFEPGELTYHYSQDAEPQPDHIAER